MKPDNAEESFKCSKCGAIYPRSGLKTKTCPHCGYVCSLETCASMGASNEDY